MGIDLAIAAAGWNYLGTLLRIASQLAAQVVLARLVGPDALGLVALAVLPVGLGSLFAELGLGAALVQKRELEPDQIARVWTRTALAGLAVTAAIWLAAPHLARLLGEVRLTPVLRFMSPVVLFNALAVAPLAKLKWGLDMKRIQIAQLGGYLAGFVGVGITAAIAGAGVWAVVASWLTFSALSFLLAWRFSGLPLRFAAVGSSVGDLRGFGRSVLLTNLCNWSVENLDNLAVGRFFGARALGFYSVSYNLVRTPANHLVVSLQSALFPASARAGDNLAHLQRGYLAVVSAVALVALPLFFTGAATADTVVLALYGEGWGEAGSVLAPLSLAMACHSLMALAGPVLAGKGRPGIELKVQVWTGLIFVSLLVVAAGSSVQAVAWAVLSVYLVRLIWMTGAALRELEITAGRFLISLRGPAVLALVVVSAAVAVEHALWLLSAAALVRLLATVATAGLALGLSIWLRPEFFLVPDLRLLIARICEARPGLMQAGFVKRLAGLDRGRL